MRRPLWIPWRFWRRATQVVLLVGFVWLFRRTEFSGSDQLPGGESLLFRLDPLAAAAAMIGGRQFIGLFWPALAMLGLTLVLGRFFCGWVCPLGTLLDIFHRVVIATPLAIWRKLQRSPLALCEKPEDAPDCIPTRRHRAVSYFLLAAVLVSALFAFPLVGLVDPFSILVRAATFWGDPAWYRAVDASFGTAEEGWTAEVLQPFVKEHFMPFRAMVFHLAGISAALLGILFALEFVKRRFWCRYLCPAGAMFGIFSMRSLIKRVPPKLCKGCGDCATVCPMGAIDRPNGLSPADCTLCMNCVDACPKAIVKFTVKQRPIASRSPKIASQPVDLSRRGLLAGIAAGVALPGAAMASQLGKEKKLPVDLIRPPGVHDEKAFLSLCVRCGECMKVCPTNVLQPAVFESGLEGLFSPRLIPRFIFEQSFCEYACTLCGQVCPSGAIPRLTEELKHAQPMGKAYFDHSRCLPWADGTPCIRCEEMCPVPDKAIKILNTLIVKDKDGNDLEIQQPYVNRDLCVGCGICESNCTIPGQAGIRVFRVDAPDPGTETLLKNMDKGTADKR